MISPRFIERGYVNYEVTELPRKSLILHPMSLFCMVWLGVYGLYEMRLSRLLIATNSQMAAALETILLPFFLAVAAFSIFFAVAPKVNTRRSQLLDGLDDAADLARFERRLKRWFVIWALITIVEIIVSGGVPTVWLLLGNGKTYDDFGIKSVHGALNALLLAIGLCYTGLYAKYGKKRYLVYFAFVTFWSVVVISRSLTIVNLLQGAIVISLYRGIPKKLAIKFAATAMLLVLGFGVIGDLRTGAEQFRELAQPSDNYPDWLPSGFLWVYTYVTTPLNNLIYSMNTVRPINSILFPNTAAPIFPSRIRYIVYGESLAESLSGDLVDPAFNVSTAFIGPYNDYGLLGVGLFSVLIGSLGVFYWSRRSFRDMLIYVVIAQCLLLTSFYNHFFSLPIITQIIWIRLFFVA